MEENRRTNEEIEKLTSDLYYSLKEEYIELRKEHDNLREVLRREISKRDSRILKITSHLYNLRIGRKNFNLALRLVRFQLVNFAKNNNWPINEVCELIKEIDSMKYPAISNENEKACKTINDYADYLDESNLLVVEAIGAIKKISKP